MPYKRKESPYYMIRRRRLSGYGDTGVISTRCTQKKLARDMERALEDVAQKALFDSTYYVLLDAVCKDHSVSLAELLKAKNLGKLESLKQSLNDPLITEVAAAFEEVEKIDRTVRMGLRMLLRYAPATTRTRDLTGKYITDLCIQAERDGRKRNSVHRMMLRAISLLLRFQLGNAERDRIFAEVNYSKEDDTREIHLAPEEIGRLLQACEAIGSHELAVVIRMALQTSADRGVLLAGKSANKQTRGLLRRDVNIYKDNQANTYTGEVFLYDNKTNHRSRTVPLTDSLCREMLLLGHNKDLDEPMFSISYQALDNLWQRVRKEAGLEHVRFKDLRAQTAIYGEEAGVPQTVLQRVMGHSDEAMTRRYQQRSAVLSSLQAEAIEKSMYNSTDLDNFLLQVK